MAVTDPRQALARATQRYRKADEQLDAAKQSLIEAVVAALRAGVPPTEVVALSPFSPAYIRVIAREHGVPPARGGPRKRGTSR